MPFLSVPAAPVVAPVPGPVIQMSPALVRQWREREGCDADAPPESWAPDAHNGVILIPYRLGGQTRDSLVLVGSAVDGHDAGPAIFDQDVSLGEPHRPDEPPVGAARENETAGLTSGVIGSQGGLCGSDQRWSWDGKRFRLISDTICNHVVFPTFRATR